MLHILVPTDLSDNALAAMRLALSLARSYHAEVIFLHAMARPLVPATSPEEVYGSIYQAEQQELEQRLQQQCQQLYLELDLRPKEVLKRVYLVPTPISDTILQITAKDSIDLLVMGASGTSGFKKLLVGSNTSLLMHITPVPLLIVPPRYNFCGFKQITVVVRLKHSGNRPGMALLERLARTYSATVVFLLILDEDEQEPAHIPFLESGAFQNGITHKVITAPKANKTRVLEDHLTATTTDLIVWLPMPSGVWDQSLSERFTEEVATEAGIPLLIIPHIEQ